MRLQLQLLKDGEGGPALTLEQAVAALMANKPDGTDGALLKVRELSTGNSCALAGCPV
jgi:hypothetical protein